MKKRTLIKSDSVDIMLLAEGTYPYVKGGVSSWIHQLIRGLPNKRFGICFLGSFEKDYEGIQYEFPDNLVHLEVHYLFQESEDPPISQRGHIEKEAIAALDDLHTGMATRESLPERITRESFFTKDVTFENFLYSYDTWEFIRKYYKKGKHNTPFIDYFWTVRSMHRPLWILASIVRNLPKTSILHSPSTGYGGFVGMLASYQKNIPFLITEHGIYTRERKIDLLTADWITYHPLALLGTPYEDNYIKDLWIRFFQKIAALSYDRAYQIISLFSGAQQVQIAFGADPAKTRIIPNGVDVDGLGKLVKLREEHVPPVIGFIGRVVSIKDVKTLIRAVRIVVDKLKTVECWIIGPDDEDPEYARECKEMVKALKLENHVKFLGFQNIRDMLPKIGILTLTSISEGMPLVVLEAFAAGVPAVTTDVGSCRDLIYGGLNDEDKGLGAAGIVTPIADPGKIGEAFISMLTDEKAWKKAQKVALERVNRFYREESFLETYDKLYDELLESK